MVIDAERYPRTAAAFAAMQADEHIARITHLDTVWHQMRTAVASNAPLPQSTVWRQHDNAHVASAAHTAQWCGDLVYAGGGLGLIHAVVMAQKGYRVLVFDRFDVGCAHREWNISRYELAALVATGFCTWDELAPVIMNEYHDGIVRFYRPDGAAVTLHLPEVLNVAIDAQALLTLARTKLCAAGGVIRDGRRFVQMM